MRYIRGFFSKKKTEGAEKKEEEKLVENRFERFLKNRLGIKTMFSKFFVLLGIAVIIGVVSFKYLKGQALKKGEGIFTGGGISKAELEAVKNFEGEKEGMVRIGKGSFLVNVAANKKEWEIGLMGVKGMHNGYGMLFDFKKPVDYGFWMKNTLIPLSILFIGHDMRVNGAVNMEPCNAVSICPQFVPKNKYIYAVEINRKKNVSKYIGKKFIIKKIHIRRVYERKSKF